MFYSGNEQRTRRLTAARRISIMAPQAQITDLYIVSSPSKQAGSSFLVDLPVQISAGSYPIKKSRTTVLWQALKILITEMHVLRAFFKHWNSFDDFQTIRNGILVAKDYNEVQNSTNEMDQYVNSKITPPLSPCHAFSVAHFLIQLISYFC